MGQYLVLPRLTPYLQPLSPGAQAEVAVRHQRRHDGVDEQHRKRAVY